MLEAPVASPRARTMAPFPVVFALYPRITQLDFTGPAEVFARLPGAALVLAAARGGTVVADGGITFANVVPLDEVRECALLCVPGGFGCAQAMEDADYLAALRRLAAQARYVTSVCTGSLLLGAAGLLRGRRAACHWAFREMLPLFGATADPARVVRDGRLITGGGVTAGIDMALTVLAEIAGRDFAESVQLGIEYAPQPPFASGHPEAARAPVVAAARGRLDSIWPDRLAQAQRVAAAQAV
ncbi:MAG: DJ-1/PfpI family protein [Proteobacteria bacterium]|nr:DJ-1/PfpI family protein [Pseudomonadota bacterium]